MIRANRKVDGVMVMGIDETSMNNVSKLQKYILEGEMKLLPENESSLYGTMISRKVADRLSVKLGDRITLIGISNPNFKYQQPMMKQFVIKGIYQSGVAYFDEVFVFIAIKPAQLLFRYGDNISGFGIRLEDPSYANVVKETLESELGYPFFPRTWFEMHHNLFSWVKLQKLPLVIVLGLIVIVAAFNITSTLIMIVMEKNRDIGILKAIGATPKDISKIFIIEGLMVGIIGVVLGSCLGFGLGWIQKTFKLFSLSTDVYFMDTVPILMRFQDFAVISFIIVLLCVVATFYPARKAANLVPVEAIRYE